MTSVAARALMGATAGLAAVLAASAARAQAPVREPASARLSWVRSGDTERCADVSVVASSVRARLGRDPFRDDAPLRIEVLVERAGGGAWVAHLFARDQAGALHGTRRLESPAASCDSLTAATALAVALLIDPDAALASDDSPPVTAPSVPAPVPAPPPSLVAPPAALRGSAVARATVALGALPVAAPGFELAFELAPRALAPAHLAVSARTFALPLQRGAGPSRGFGFALTAGALGLCFAPPALRDRVALGACAHGYAGALDAVVYELLPTEPGAQPWGALGLEGRARVRVAGPVWVELGLEALAPVVRHRFFVRGREGTVFQQPIALGRGSLGVAVTIP